MFFEVNILTVTGSKVLITIFREKFSSLYIASLKKIPIIY